jgi:hypothetical protein
MMNNIPWKKVSEEEFNKYIDVLKFGRTEELMENMGNYLLNTYFWLDYPSDEQRETGSHFLGKMISSGKFYTVDTWEYYLRTDLEYVSLDDQFAAKFAWNKTETTGIRFWDHDIEDVSDKSVTTSLKQRLYNTANGINSTEVIADIAKGLAMIMDELEKNEK